MTPLLRAHAHNDYEHTRPLLDALDEGFCSVEADVHLVDGALLVAHDRAAVRPERTLDALYLEPLFDRFHRYGHIHSEPAPCQLLVDIKTDGPAVWDALKPKLARVRPMLTRFANGRVIPGALTVVLSGDRPMKEVAADRDRLAALDGRFADLDAGVPAFVAPLISESWLGRFSWFGSGIMSRKDRDNLADFVDRCHREKRKVRFWAAPDNVAGWSVLDAAGVDYLNTDKLAQLGTYLRNHGRSGAC